MIYFKKKSQIAIYVILGLMIIIVIAIFFIMNNDKDQVIINQKDPILFIESCTKDLIIDTLAEVLVKGGTLNPKQGVMYNGANVTYLCYTDKDFDKCIAQEPMLVSDTEIDMTQRLTPIFSECFDRLQKSLEKDSTVSMQRMSLKTSIHPQSVIIKINKKITIQKDEDTQTYDEFIYKIQSPLYELIDVVQKIIYDEARTCEFDYITHNTIYRDYEIELEISRDTEDIEIYTITDMITNKKLKFAIRGCKFPVGARL